MPETHKNTSSKKRKRSRTHKPIKASPNPTPRRETLTLSRNAKRALVAGAAVVAASAAATGAIVMRHRIGKLAGGALSFGGRLGTSFGREITGLDLTRLLAYAGLKKGPSLLRRLLPPVGVLAALVAAGGSALFLIAPRLRARDEDAPAPQKKTVSSSSPRASTLGDSTANHNSIGGSIGEIVEEGIAHATK
jgi:hypothetical protein